MASEGFTDSALHSFIYLSKFDPANANLNYRIGVLYLQSRSQKTQSVPYLVQAATNVTKKYVPDDPGEKRAPELVYYYLGQAFQLDYQFDDAVRYFEKFKELIPKKNVDVLNDIDRRIEMCWNGKEFMKKAVPCRITNLGPTVNSEYPDYSPVISADESVIYFTSRRKGTGGADNKTFQGEYFEDIWQSDKKKDETWDSARSISPVINSLENEATIGLSADGQTLLIYKDDKGDGNIYFSQLNGDQWTSPEKFEPDINSPSWEPSACIRADGNTMYIVSDRKGGYGGRDIYRVVKLPNGKWSKALNLGPKINTPYDEDAPFIHPDGKTLFFASNGHKTMGGFDIFFSTNMGTDTSWSEPENVGFPINTTDDDIYYVTSADGRRGYFSSARPGGFGEKDIYMVTLEKDVVEPVTLLKGYLTFDGTSNIPTSVTIKVVDNDTKLVIQEVHPNSKTGKYLLTLSPGTTGKTYVINYEAEGYQPISETITVTPEQAYQEIDRTLDMKNINFESKTLGTIAVTGTIKNKEGKPIPGAQCVVKDNATSQLVDTYFSNIQTGMYYFVLQRGQNFNLSYEAEGYLFQSENVNVPKEKTYSQLEKNIVLEPIKAGAKIVLNNIFFDSGKSSLRKESNTDLDKLLKLMKDKPELKIEVSGHTDNKGARALNMTLSQSRAQAVVNYLAKKGIDKKRLVAKGYGPDQPVAPNTLPNGKPDLKGMQLNRRVEMKIVGDT